VATRRLFACVVAVICGWIAFAVYSTAAQGRALDSQVTQMRQENIAVQQQISDRKREIAAAQTKAWLAEQARKLGYVLPGETVYVITNPGGVTPARGGVEVKLPTYSPAPVATPTSPPVAPAVSPSPTPPPLVLPPH